MLGVKTARLDAMSLAGCARPIPEATSLFEETIEYGCKLAYS
jgi:hypothetical protein